MTKHIDAQKFSKAARLSRSEQRAANTDTWVKQHLSEARDAEAHKRARLKAMRDARDAAPSPEDAEPHAEPQPVQLSGDETP